jgi:hypothetical protein
MAKVKGFLDGKPVWWNGQAWSFDSKEAERLSNAEADRRVRITNANNRFLDRDERVEAVIVESK